MIVLLQSLPLAQPHLRDLLDGAHDGVEALRPMPGPDSGGELTETLRSLLSTILFHQGFHAGQTGLLRRIAGKPGAIP